MVEREHLFVVLCTWGFIASMAGAGVAEVLLWFCG